MKLYVIKHKEKDVSIYASPSLEMVKYRFEKSRNPQVKKLYEIAEVYAYKAKSIKL